ncbi:hypothetical protein C8J56DRAFT_1024169, partial [Mycena floridula]
VSSCIIGQDRIVFQGRGKSTHHSLPSPPSQARGVPRAGGVSDGHAKDSFPLFSLYGDYLRLGGLITYVCGSNGLPRPSLSPRPSYNRTVSDKYCQRDHKTISCPRPFRFHTGSVIHFQF